MATKKREHQQKRKIVEDDSDSDDEIESEFLQLLFSGRQLLFSLNVRCKFKHSLFTYLYFEVTCFFVHSEYYAEICHRFI